MDLIIVVLPAPFGPTIAINVPDGTSMSTSHNTGLSL
jgi:hypothetical protein